jgi:hypothetical protein
MTQLVWQKSSFSGGGNGDCVEVATAPDGLVHLRESDRPDEIVTTTRVKLDAFVKGVKAGEFDHFSV